MIQTDEPRRMLVIGVGLGATIGILGNLWVGALLNIIGKDFAVNISILVIGLIAWVWAFNEIFKMIGDKKIST